MGLSRSLSMSIEDNAQNGSVLNYDPATDLDLAFRINARSGLTLPDLVSTNTPDILVPVAAFNGAANYISRPVKITGGQAWDLTVRFKLTTASGNNPLVNCGGYSGGTKGLLIRVNSGALNIFTSNGTASVSSNFAFNFQNATWYTLRFQWNGQTSGTMTCTVGATALTASTCNAWTGDSGDSFQIGKYSTTYLTGSISKVSGTCGSLAIDLYPTGLGTIAYDSNGVSFSWSGTPGTAYDTGDSWFLDKGFQIFKDGSNNYQYACNNSLGLPTITRTDLGGTYALYSSAVGSLTSHNLWKSKIRFKNAFFDRSNTIIWNATARTGFYDSGNTKDFDITEINLLTLRSFLNDGYRGKLYPVCDGNSIDDKLYLQGVLLYTTDKKGANELVTLKYTKDIRRTQKVIDTGAYILDAEGYIKTYLYDDLGGDADANFTYLQGILNSGNLTVSGSKYDVYAISQPLIPVAGRTITINTELRPKKATIVNLTANVLVGDTVINVDSVVGFNIGEWIAISDNLLPVQGSQTRRVASSGRITNVGATTITIHSGSKYAITAASGGKLGHCQSVILIDTVNNVTTSGSGIINGNKDNQYDVEPVSTNGVEEVRMGCCITNVLGNDIKFLGNSSKLELKNAVMHGVVMMGRLQASGIPQINVTGCEVGNIYSHHNHDKNGLALATNGLYLHDYLGESAMWEDGFTFYTQNTNFVINNVVTVNNYRAGLNILANINSLAIISNVVTEKLFISSSQLIFNNIICTDYVYIHDQYYGNLITISGLSFTNVSATAQLQLIGAVSDIEINNMTFDGCISSTAAIYVNKQTAGSVYPARVVIANGGIANHVGVKTLIVPTSDVTFTNFTGL